MFIHRLGFIEIFQKLLAFILFSPRVNPTFGSFYNSFYEHQVFYLDSSYPKQHLGFILGTGGRWAGGAAATAVGRDCGRGGGGGIIGRKKKMRKED